MSPLRYSFTHPALPFHPPPPVLLKRDKRAVSCEVSSQPVASGCAHRDRDRERVGLRARERLTTADVHEGMERIRSARLRKRAFMRGGNARGRDPRG